MPLNNQLEKEEHCPLPEHDGDTQLQLTLLAELNDECELGLDTELVLLTELNDDSEEFEL